MVHGSTACLCLVQDLITEYLSVQGTPDGHHTFSFLLLLTCGHTLSTCMSGGSLDAVALVTGGCVLCVDISVACLYTLPHRSIGLLSVIRISRWSYRVCCILPFSACLVRFIALVNPHCRCSSAGRVSCCVSYKVSSLSDYMF